MQAAGQAAQCSIPAAAVLLPHKQHDRRKLPVCLSRSCRHSASRAAVRAKGATAVSRPGRTSPCWTVLCAASRSQQQDLPLDAPSPDAVLGLACLPGVVSPQHFQAYWLRVCKPRIEALYRTAAGMGVHPSLLPVIDQLISELKQVSVPAHHCAQRHEEASWRSAAADVAQSCDKFEQYLYRSKGLYGKVCEAQRRLQAALYEASLQQDSNRGKALQSSIWLKGLEDGFGRQASSQQLLRLASLLRYNFERQGVAVEDGLSHFLASHSPATSDPAWADATQLLQKERRIAARVRAAIADVSLAPVLELADIHWPSSSPRSCNAQSSRPVNINQQLHTMPMEARQPPWSGDAALARLILRTPQLSGRPAVPVAVTLGMSAVPGPQPELVSRLSPGWSSADEDDHSQPSAGQTEGTAVSCQRAASPNLLAQHAGSTADYAISTADSVHTQAVANAATSGRSAGVPSSNTEASRPGVSSSPALWSDAILLDRSATQELLRHHPVASLRSAVLEEGCMRRMLVMLQLVSQQTAIRAQIAELYNEPSFAHVMQPEGQCAHGGPEEILHTLKQVAKAILPAAQAQVHNMEQLQQTLLKQHSTEVSSGTCNQQQDGDHLIDAADVAYLQQELQRQSGLDVSYEEMEAYLHLPSLLQGLSDVLTHSMGLSLEITYQPSNWHHNWTSVTHTSHNHPHTASHTSSSIDSPQLWCSEGQVIVHVFDHDRPQTNGAARRHNDGPQSHNSSSASTPVPLAGIIYLDMGAGYGTRQLRFVHTWGKPNPQQLAAEPRAQVQEHPQQATHLHRQPQQGAPQRQGEAQQRTLQPQPPHRELLQPQSPHSDFLQAQPRHSETLQPQSPHSEFLQAQPRPSEFLQPQPPHSDFLRAQPRHTEFLQEQVGVVSVGLQRSWQGGAAGSFSAVWELFHELGHALHLLLSSKGQLFKHWGGLHLPLDVLEVPSMWLERMLVHPASLRTLCRQGDGQQLPAVTSERLAQQFKATHCSALDFQEQVLVALADQLLAQSGAEEAPDALACYSMVQERFSAVPHVPVTLKRLSALPVAAHHQAMFWAYTTSALAAAQLWDDIASSEPLSPAQGRLIRQVLLESGADMQPHNVLASIKSAGINMGSVTGRDTQHVASDEKDGASDAKDGACDVRNGSRADAQKVRKVQVAGPAGTAEHDVAATVTIKEGWWWTGASDIVATHCSAP